MNACSAKKEEVIKIEDTNFSGMLLIQKVKDNASSDEMTKIVRDKQKIEKVLKMVEGLEVKETDTDYMIDKMKSQDSYSFSFTEGEKIESGKETPYTIVAFNDGTFFFTHDEVNAEQPPRMTIVEHKELLNEMRQLLDVDF